MPASQKHELEIIINDYNKGIITRADAETSIREVMSNAQIEETVPRERAGLLYDGGRASLQVEPGGDNITRSFGEEPEGNGEFSELATGRAPEDIDRGVIYERLTNTGLQIWRVIQPKHQEI